MNNPLIEGIQAFNQGKTTQNNPYPVDGKDYLMWLEGWCYGADRWINQQIQADMIFHDMINNTPEKKKQRELALDELIRHDQECGLY